RRRHTATVRTATVRTTLAATAENEITVGDLTMAQLRIGSEEDNPPVSVSRLEDRGGGAGMAVVLIILGLAAIVGPFFIEKIPALSKIIISGAGLGVLIAGGILLTITSMYVKATMNQAFVRTGGGGPKVVIDGGAIVIPAIHRIAWVSL